MYGVRLSIDMDYNKLQISFTSIYRAKASFEKASFIHITATPRQTPPERNDTPYCMVPCNVMIRRDIWSVSGVLAMRAVDLLTPFSPQFVFILVQQPETASV